MATRNKVTATPAKVLLAGVYATPDYPSCRLFLGCRAKIPRFGVVCLQKKKAKKIALTRQKQKNTKKHKTPPKSTKTPPKDEKNTQNTNFALTREKNALFQNK